MTEAKPKHTRLTKQQRADIQAANGGYPNLETITGVRDDYARAKWPKHTPGPWHTSPLVPTLAVVEADYRRELEARRLLGSRED